MTLEELIAHKQNLERKLVLELREFEATTGTLIQDLRIEREGWSKLIEKVPLVVNTSE